MIANLRTPHTLRANLQPTDIPYGNLAPIDLGLDGETIGIHRQHKNQFKRFSILPEFLLGADWLMPAPGQQTEPTRFDITGDDTDVFIAFSHANHYAQYCLIRLTTVTNVCYIERPYGKKPENIESRRRRLLALELRRARAHVAAKRG